jgi:asparagine synthase (glutamine-hydrolysing)
VCGFIAGFFSRRVSGDLFNRSLDLLRKRGPDAEGRWLSDDGSVFMGHRRLAIIDLDQRSHQPMVSSCGRYVIAFNGEIYNFVEIRDRLQKKTGRVFRTHSDTEVLVELFAVDGASMLSQLHGMFAFVIWDKVSKKAFVARDPYGIKPLYITVTKDGCLVSSQVKALIATGLVSSEPDLRGQAGFWMLGSVPEPNTWFRDIRVLRAGHYTWMQDGVFGADVCWSDIGDCWRQPKLAKEISDRELKEIVRKAIKESVSRHIVADVPVGVFLSGGIDSGALAGLMVEAGIKELHGVTISYDEFKGKHEDETPCAAMIASHYGIRHHVRRVTREEFWDDLPVILADMDQPSIDGINTWYATKAVAELGLKVVVSGVGGDELFFGYESFRVLPRIVTAWGALSRLPGLPSLACSVADLKAVKSGNARWKFAPDWAKTIAGAWWLRRSIRAPSDLISVMKDGSDKLFSDHFEVNEWISSMAGPVVDTGILGLAQIESMTYLRNQLLRDSDWASMAHSVELRTPLVDEHLLRSLAPYLSQMSRIQKKRLLAEAPLNSLPESLISRKKTGFGIPVKDWLRASPNLDLCSQDSNWSDFVAHSYAKSITDN